MLSMEYPRKFLLSHFDLSDDAYEVLRRHIERVVIQKGTVLIHQNEYHPFVYLIREGVVKAFVTKGRNEIVTSFWMDNEIFADISCYICNKPAIHSFEVAETIVAYRINITTLRALFAENIEICNVGRLLVEDYVVRNQCINELLTTMTSKEKYEAFMAKRCGLIDRVRLKDIASFLNTTPETISRIRREHKKTSL